MIRGSMWRHLAHMMPQGHGRGGPWWAETDFDVRQQQVVLTLWDGAG